MLAASKRAQGDNELARFSDAGHLSMGQLRFWTGPSLWVAMAGQTPLHLLELGLRELEEHLRRVELWLGVVEVSPEVEVVLAALAVLPVLRGNRNIPMTNAREDCLSKAEERSEGRR